MYTCAVHFSVSALLRDILIRRHRWIVRSVFAGCGGFALERLRAPCQGESGHSSILVGGNDTPLLYYGPRRRNRKRFLFLRVSRAAAAACGQIATLLRRPVHRACRCPLVFGWARQVVRAGGTAGRDSAWLALWPQEFRRRLGDGWCTSEWFLSPVSREAYLLRLCATTSFLFA